ncbi:MAG TPA: glycosyltransferase, partial [Saprospiraceae bacterium]|nr:glycosyltransferase [Saprospiraceae bacterium]
MGKITHYLVTRFNIRIDGYGPEWMHGGITTPGWEIKRLPLFEHYCAPTVNHQANTDFTWIIYCDARTPDNILHRIRQAIAPSVQYDIVLTENYASMLMDLRYKCANCPTPYVITTRLDNDDGIGEDFIKEIQAHFTGDPNVLLNVLGGVNYDCDKKIFTYHRYSLRNSFMSLVESTNGADQLLTILGFRHLAPPAEMKIINIPLRYGFWMTLHDQNAAQRINLGWPVRAKPILSHYHILPADVRTSWINTSTYFITWLPKAVYRKMKFKIRSLFSKPIASK